MFHPILEYKMGSTPWYNDPYYPYSNKMWWLFDSRESSGKTCNTCLALHMNHFRGDEIASAFPYHIQMAPNRIRAKVHPNCRCVLAWTGRTKDTLENPYGLLKRPADKATLPDRVAGRPIVLSPSQKRLYDRTSGYARETWKKRRKCKCH